MIFDAQEMGSCDINIAFGRPWIKIDGFCSCWTRNGFQNQAFGVRGVAKNNFSQKFEFL
jgi:hypothetical protein